MQGPLMFHGSKPDSGARVEQLRVSVYRVPTDAPESDGTFEWQATTLVLVEVTGGGALGLGYTYADTATATLIRDTLTPVVSGRNAMDVAASWIAMVRSIRNLGRPGVASMAISAVDVALWDLKARILGVPLVTLLGAAHEAVPVYGSGGFTSYSLQRLRDQLAGWVGSGIPRVKMKIGRDPAADPERVRVAREAIGPDAELFVDANGAYSRKQALARAYRFREQSVTWFEEPVSSDDLDGLRLLRDEGPPGMDIAAGEYGYDLPYFRRMLDARAVDVLQADITRCGGISEFLRVGALCQARSMPLSAHCAPTITLHAACAVTNFLHIEYFHDHDRIEHMLFDGSPGPVGGKLHPDLSRPGLGIEFKRKDAEPFAL
jgi:L-alanine-DL-glutamate epimerase-like enolase superfamily enzyme